MSNTPSYDDGGNPPPHPPLAVSRRLTTELVITVVVAILGALMAAGVFTTDSLPAQIIGAILAVAAHLGYTASRAVVKSAEAKAVANLADSAAKERAVSSLANPTKRQRSTE